MNEKGHSKVYDFGDAVDRIITLTENRYGAGQGTATLQMRGQAAVFTQDAANPAWEAYSAPASKDWRFIQVREIKES